MNVLLVTGSRLLATIPGALGALGEIALPLIHAADVVVAGDADGPDDRALALARKVRKITHKWCLDGNLVIYKPLSDGTGHFSRAPWWRDADPRPPPNRWPLTRNRRMVEFLKQFAFEDRVLAKIAGAEPFVRLLCVGFVDPDSRTHGTDHTLGLARRAGIWCARYVWQGAGFEEQS